MMARAPDVMIPRPGSPPGGGEDTRISVVIPCYNASAFVGDAVASIFGQSHRALEIICVDDGSTDGTADVLESLRRASPFPFQIVRTPNGGSAAARNRGLALASGEYVQFMDADDILGPEKIARQLRISRSAPGGVDLVAGGYTLRSASGEETVRGVDTRSPAVALIGSNLGITSSNLWRTEAVRGVCGFDEKLPSSQEYDLMFRLMAAGARVAVDSAADTVVRRRAGSVSRRRRREFCITFVRLRQRMLAHFRATGEATPDLEEAFREIVFRKIRELATYDLESAAELYTEVLPSGYVPPEGTATRQYALALRLLGFRRTQILWSLLERRVR